MQRQFEDSLAATIVSLFPLEITEHKPGLYPGYFVIPAAPIGELSYLVVGDSIFYQETKNDQVTSVRTSFQTVAASIVDDFQRSHIGRIIGEAEPGLFWVPGAFRNQGKIREMFGELVDEAQRRQNRWFEELVKIADDTWSRTHRHTSVSTLQRLAAHALGTSRDWVIRTGESMNTCRFCKAEVPYGAVKCPTCREIIDMQAYREMVGDPNAHNVSALGEGA